MGAEQEDTLTRQDLATLLQDGHGGVNANISRIALEEVIDEWENDTDKAEKLVLLRESSITPYALSPEIDYDSDTEQFLLAPNNGPQVAHELRHSSFTAMAKEFAEDYFTAYCERYRELFEESTLTKKQFMVYLMKEANQNEHMISGALDMEIGTMRSHAGRARNKIMEAENTAKIPELFHIGDMTDFREDVKGKLEPASS